MVVFVDLEDVDDHDIRGPPQLPEELTSWPGDAGDAGDAGYDVDDNDGDDDAYSLQNRFADALCCYPVVLQIASQLDLNSLHDLSATCRQFRETLLQHRTQLMRATLRCRNEAPEERPSVRHSEDKHGDAVEISGPIVRVRATARGKLGSCAHDMVRECRRCDAIVCRNCTVKPPSTRALEGRMRRLCRTCMKAPLLCHTSQTPDLVEPLTHHRLALGGLRLGACPGQPHHFTAEAFSRSACSCASAVFICNSCGSGLRSADLIYMQGWSWRSRYSSFAGYGAGIGEGNEGVPCGRGPQCLAAKEVEKELDCDADELAEMQRECEKVKSAGRQWGGTSYMTQQIQGIGGVMKTKVKKMVKVGQVVKEYEEEREDGRYLAREGKRINRAWCCWCDRVIPSLQDEATVDARGEPAAALSCSSSSSLASSHFHDTPLSTPRSEEKKPHLAFLLQSP